MLQRFRNSHAMWDHTDVATLHWLFAAVLFLGDFGSNVIKKILVIV